MGRGAGVGVELGEGVGEAERRATCSLCRGRVMADPARRDAPAIPARSRFDPEAERPAAARVSFCCRGFGGRLAVVLEGRDMENAWDEEGRRAGDNVPGCRPACDSEV